MVMLIDGTPPSGPPPAPETIEGTDGEPWVCWHEGWFVPTEQIIDMGIAITHALGDASQRLGQRLKAEGRLLKTVGAMRWVREDDSTGIRGAVQLLVRYKDGIDPELDEPVKEESKT